MAESKRWSSVRLSQACLLVFALLLLALDGGGYWVVRWFLGVSHGLEGWRDGALLMASLYACSVPSWLALWSLWRLLGHIADGEVFCPACVRCLRATGRCCFCVCLLTALSALYYLPMVLLALAAGFIGAIVRTVQCAFETACRMQDELSFTI